MRQDKFFGPVNIGSEEMVTIKKSMFADFAILCSNKNLKVKKYPWK